MLRPGPLPVLDVRSPDFEHLMSLPLRHSAAEDNVPPALSWSGVPVEAAELLLVCEDPDAETGACVHWLVAGIDPAATGVAPGCLPSGAEELSNSFGTPGWFGPAQPPADGPHRYVFTVYALAEPVTLDVGRSVTEVHRLARDRALARGSLIAFFRR